MLPQGCSMKDDTICEYICRLRNGARLAEPGANVASIYFEIQGGRASQFGCSPQRRIDPIIRWWWDHRPMFWRDRRASAPSAMLDFDPAIGTGI
jgi:hypothetical protein